MGITALVLLWLFTMSISWLAGAWWAGTPRDDGQYNWPDRQP